MKYDVTLTFVERDLRTWAYIELHAPGKTFSEEALQLHVTQLSQLSKVREVETTPRSIIVTPRQSYSRRFNDQVSKYVEAHFRVHLHTQKEPAKITFVRSAQGGGWYAAAVVQPQGDSFTECTAQLLLINFLVCGQGTGEISTQGITILPRGEIYPHEFKRDILRVARRHFGVKVREVDFGNWPD